jgi:RND family efflux transporter MFP subunit
MNPLLKLEQNSRLRLVVAVPESEAGAIVKSAHVAFTVPAFPGQRFSGVVSRLPRSMDAKTRTMPVEADVDNSSGRLAPGMYPEVEWPSRSGRAALLVPPTAIVTTTERTFVIRVSDGRAEWVDVRKGSSAGDLVEVLGSLKEGDRVVRRGSDELRPGTPIK